MEARGRPAGRLGLFAGGLLALGFLVGIQLPLFFGRFPHRPQTVDLLNYLAAAHVGLTHGWDRIYDRALQEPAYLAVSGAPRFEWFNLFVSPPPVAWLAAPLTGLNVDLAFYIWDALSLAVFAAAVWRCSPWTGMGRLVALVVGFCLFPVLIAFQFGQITPLLAGCLGLAYCELRAGRQVRAALWLIPLALKPQVGVLVPLALLLAGHRRVFLVWAGGALALALVSVASIGTQGMQQLLADLAEEQKHLDNQLWTVAVLVGVGPQTVVAEVACAVAALATGWLTRRRADPALPMVAGALGTLLGAGYHHSIDFPSLLPLGLVQLGLLRGPAAAVFAIPGVLACLVIPPAGPAPLLLFCVAWLALSLVTAAAPSLLESVRATRRPEAAPASPLS